MALDFPANPTLNQVYTSGNRSWVWNGTAWIGDPNGFNYTANRVLLGNGANPFQEIAPGTVGNILTSNGTTWTSLPSPTPPASPTNVTATASATAGRIDVSWTASQGSTGYTVYYGLTNPVSIANSAGNVTSLTTSAALTGLTGGTTYYIVVVGTNGYGNSILSSQVTQTANGVPTAPAITAKSPTGATSISVSWTAGTGTPSVTSHRLYYSTTSPVTTSSTSVLITSSPHSLTGLTASTTYYLAVGAINSYGTTLSAQSTQATLPSGTTTYTAGQTLDVISGGAVDDVTFIAGAGVTSMRVVCAGGGGAGGGGWNYNGGTGASGGYAEAVISLAGIPAGENRVFRIYRGRGGIGTTPYVTTSYMQGGDGGGGTFFVGYFTNTVYVAAGGGGGGGSGWANSAGAGGDGGNITTTTTGFVTGSSGGQAAGVANSGGLGGGQTAGTNSNSSSVNAVGNAGGNGGNTGGSGGASNSGIAPGGRTNSTAFWGGGGGGGGYLGGAGGWGGSSGGGGGGGGSYINPTYCTGSNQSTLSRSGGGAGATGPGDGYTNAFGFPGTNGAARVIFS